MTERTSDFASTYDDDTAAVKSVAPIYNMISNLRNDTFVVRFFFGLSALNAAQMRINDRKKASMGKFLVALQIPFHYYVLV